MFVGRMTTPSALAAAALATSVYNTTGKSVFDSVKRGQSTLSGQAFGARDYRAVGVILQTAFLLVLAFMVPIGALWLGSRPLLAALMHQGPRLSRDASRYLYAMCVPILVASLRESVLAWMQSQSIVRPFTATTVLTFGAAFPVTYGLVRGLGYLGGAVATGAIAGLQLALDAAWILWARAYARTWTGVHLGEALRLALPLGRIACSCILMFSELWAAEVIVILAGNLGGDDGESERLLAAQAVYQNINSIGYTQCVAFGEVVSVRVAQELGAGNPAGARLAAVSGASVSLAVAGAYDVLLLSARRLVGSLFTRDAELRSLISSLMPLLAVFHLMNAVSAALGGVLTGARLQKWGAWAATFSYFVVGVPSAVLLAFTADLGIYGLVLGRLIGKLAHALIFVCVVLRMDWGEQSARASRLLDAIGSGKDGESSVAAGGFAVEMADGENHDGEGDDDDDDDDDV